MKPYFDGGDVQIYLGDCRDILAELSDASVDAIVTDPPYEIAFMGRSWDSAGVAFDPATWAACWRILKPGGHLLAFGGTRTYHRMTVAIEDAGFEIRDSIHWIYGSGFPKSLDVSKAIDRRRDDQADICRVTSWLADQAEARGVTKRDVDEHMGTSDMGGWWLSRLPHRAAMPTWEQWQRLRTFIGCGDELDAEVWRLNGRKGTPGEAWEQREVIGQRTTGLGTGRGSVAVIGDSDNRDITAAASDDARRWQGWGTALKPGHEPIVVARKPLAGTVAANVLAHGTGAINIDACRTPASGRPERSATFNGYASDTYGTGRSVGLATGTTDTGRWPTNIVLTHSASCNDGPCPPGCPVAELDRQSGVLHSGANPTRRGSDKFREAYGDFRGQETCVPARGADSGGASRFFPVFRYEAKAPASERPRGEDGTAHVTVKPLALMRWLVRLVTSPGGVVLDPFLGSGTTAEACVIEGFRCIGVERDEAHLPLIEARLSKPIQPTLGFEDAS